MGRRWMWIMLHVAGVTVMSVTVLIMVDSDWRRYLACMELVAAAP